MDLPGQVIGAAIEVHRHLGPGLLESAYQRCLAWEFDARGIAYERERPAPVSYKGAAIDCGYRLDFVVGGSLVVETKSVECLTSVHLAQVLTYLKLGGWRLGLLLNFNAQTMREGIRRVIL